MKAPDQIRSRSNPLLVQVHKLARDGAAYRRQGQLWVEGEHLCAAARQRGLVPAVALLSEEAAASGLLALADGAERVVVVPAALFRQVSGLESPVGIGFVLPLPAMPAIDPRAASVVLDRVQDAGNVGSILRSAAAFGVRQVLALAGTAALWSPKVLRAGMGAHFGLRLVEGLAESDLSALAVPLLATSSHTAQALAKVPLPSPCAWVLGHEGQGVSATLQARCAMTLRIPQPGGEESRNVAAAAAVCLYESARRQ
jgi:RNA methyltransferase, TrmH family